MAADEARREGEDAIERRKRMAEYNLEKPPLQTGRQVSEVSAREEVAFKPDDWTMRRRIAGKLGILFIALIVLIGAVVIWLVWRIFETYYAIPELLGGLSGEQPGCASPGSRHDHPDVVGPLQRRHARQHIAIEVAHNFRIQLDPLDPHAIA